MPELPEVHTIVEELQSVIPGKRVSAIAVFDKKIRKPEIVLPFAFTDVTRHGKFIVCHAKGGKFLLHLRMTGELLFSKNSSPQVSKILKLAPIQKNERFAFLFADGSVLRFFDTRRFGTLEWRPQREGLPTLGVDPLSPAFTPEFLYSATRKSRQPIKSFILDQKKIAGIGNIYADEALWFAGVHPKRRADSITRGEAGKIAVAVRRVLHKGIKLGGFTLRDYRRLDGSFGYYQKSRKAYGREGEACLRCGTKIRRIKVGGRSAYFCPDCAR